MEFARRATPVRGAASVTKRYEAKGDEPYAVIHTEPLYGQQRSNCWMAVFDTGNGDLPLGRHYSKEAAERACAAHSKK